MKAWVEPLCDGFAARHEGSAGETLIGWYRLEVEAQTAIDFWLRWRR